MDSQKLLTPRQHALYRLIYANSVEGRKTTQKEICDTLSEYGYKYTDSNNTSDHCSIIWNDITALNLSFEKEKIIITKNYEYWIGNEKETVLFLDDLWKSVSPKLTRYWAYLRKVSRNGQGKLLSALGNPIDDSSKARRFVESYLPTDDEGEL